MIDGPAPVEPAPREPIPVVPIPEELLEPRETDPARLKESTQDSSVTAMATIYPLLVVGIFALASRIDHPAGIEAAILMVVTVGLVYLETHVLGPTRKNREIVDHLDPRVHPRLVPGARIEPRLRWIFGDPGGSAGPLVEVERPIPWTSVRLVAGGGRGMQPPQVRLVGCVGERALDPPIQSPLILRHGYPAEEDHRREFDRLRQLGRFLAQNLGIPYLEKAPEDPGHPFRVLYRPPL